MTSHVTCKLKVSGICWDLDAMMRMQMR